MTEVEIKHAHTYCGLGGGKKGFNRGNARAGNLVAKFRCIGGIDIDAAAIADFNRTGEGRAGVVMDLFSLEQYRAFHGHEPPAGWREATIDDFRAAYGNEFPNIWFLSAPCKGFSGLLSEARSRTGKYQALNELTLRGVWLGLEAWKDNPPEAILFENVPRIANRGRPLLDRIIQLLQAYGYATAETTHDCGELGNLAQSRKRFLLIARHVVKVPPFIYEPIKRPLRAVGEVLERFPLPGDAAAGAMHRMSSLQAKTWIRLAFVEAGSDWRSLNRLAVADGVLRDFALVPEVTQEGSGPFGVHRWGDVCGAVATRCGPTNGAYSVADPRLEGVHHGVYGVKEWTGNAQCVQGSSRPANGQFSIADPRIEQSAEFGQLGVRRWSEPTGVVSGQSTVGGGTHAVADPRLSGPPRYNYVLRVVRWAGPAGAVTGANAGTAAAVADPRPPSGPLFSKYSVARWDGKTGTVISGDDTGAYAVADPRCGDRDWRSGPYGVALWRSPAMTIAANADPHNGYHSVADPRLPAANDRLVMVIRAMDGTWHRPFTTLELAALQGLVDPEEHLELEGLSDSAWRERIGNAVPPPAAAAVAGVIGRAILGAWTGESFTLSSEPVWVRPVAIALTVAR